MIQTPTTAKEYIGYNAGDITSYIQKTYTGTAHRRYVILYGPAGTGKTTLANVIANDENLTIRYSNASDTRRLKDLNENDYLTSGIDNTKVMIVLDECESMMKPVWKRVDELAKLNYKIPIILITNTISKIPDKIRKQSIEKEITVNHFSLKAFTKRINIQENLGLTDTRINDIVDQCTSFRGVITLLKYGYNDTYEIPQSQQEQILSALHGDYTEFKPGDLRDVITVMHDNVKSPELISQADIYYKRYETGYTYGRYVVNACLNAIRSKRIKLDYPRTYSLIYKARNKKSDIKEKNRKKNLPNIEITGLKR